MQNEIILFETADKEIKLTVSVKNNTVWLNRNQLAKLFGRDVKTIGKHINNALKEELDNSVVANFATTASLLEWLTPILSENTSKSETIQCIRKNLPDIRKEATRMAAPEPVTVTLQKEWFPEKTYGTCTFPEGIYDALRVDIGQAKGHNWWCVLYPSLCFADALEPSMTEEGEEKLQQVLDEDAYDLLLHPQKLKIRFRLEFFLRNR